MEKEELFEKEEQDFLVPPQELQELAKQRLQSLVEFLKIAVDENHEKNKEVLQSLLDNSTICEVGIIGNNGEEKLFRYAYLETLSPIYPYSIEKLEFCEEGVFSLEIILPTKTSFGLSIVLKSKEEKRLFKQIFEVLLGKEVNT